MSDKEIIDAIKAYADAYNRLQLLQEATHSIPEGDQKTGCIGEYYAYKYIESLHPESKLKYGSHSEKGWDISIIENNSERKIQVKTVSAYSKTRTISPIHKGWDELYQIYLNKALYPEGFWVITETNIFGTKEHLNSKKCPLPNNPNTGSKEIPFGNNLISELLRVLNA